MYIWMYTFLYVFYGDKITFTLTHMLLPLRLQECDGIGFIQLGAVLPNHMEPDESCFLPLCSHLNCDPPGRTEQDSVMTALRKPTEWMSSWLSSVLLLLQASVLKGNRKWLPIKDRTEQTPKKKQKIKMWGWGVFMSALVGRSAMKSGRVTWVHIIKPQVTADVNSKGAFPHLACK